MERDGQKWVVFDPGILFYQIQDSITLGRGRKGTRKGKRRSQIRYHGDITILEFGLLEFSLQLRRQVTTMKDVV